MDTKAIYHQTTRHFLGPVLSLLDDDDVSEVLINGHETVYFERSGKIEKSDITFPSESFLLAAARNIAEFVGRTLSEDHQSMDARLPDGSRVHVVIPPCSRNGVCISIRKFNRSSFDLAQLVKWGALSEQLAEFLSLCVKMHRNIVIAGGTGTGKTSLLNALSYEIPTDERIVVIEDSSELQLQQPHTVYLEAQPARPDGGGGVTIRDLFVDSLRMRPDRIVVGEVRRGEALDLIQSMISGHDGTMTTVHASTARDAAIRLETLSMMSDVSIPAHVARVQVASALHLIVNIKRDSDGRRRIDSVSECLGTNASGDYEFQELFSSDMSPNGPEITATGTLPSFAKLPSRFGLVENVRLNRRLFQLNGSAR